MLTHTGIRIYFIFLIASTSFALDILENSDVEVLEDEFQLHRFKRETDTVESSGFICSDTDTQACEIVGKECKCECKPQFYSNGNQGCLRGKQFGGEITFIGNGFMEDEILQTITTMFIDEEFFVNATLFSFSSESRHRSVNITVATYQLTYQNVEIVSNSYITAQFDDNYDCLGNETVDVDGVVVDLNSTCETFLDTDGKILCSGSFNETCDLSTSDCKATPYGYVECQCFDGYYSFSSSSCQKQVCVENSDCNYPFGWCSKGEDVYKCTCMWGFDGYNCFESWIFTLTVVASGSFVIIFSLMIALICCSTKNKKLQKQSKLKAQKVASRDQEDPTPMYKLGGYQPGLMRARLPDSSRNPGRNPSEYDLGETGIRNGHSNNAFDTSMNSTTTFNTRKPRYSRGPADYF